VPDVAASGAAPRPLRVLVVDDEPPARQRLLELLAREAAHLGPVEACEGGRAAVDALAGAARAGRPVELLFLDVQMPEVDGFAVLEAAAASPAGAAALPAVVFVTAYDQYALRAFDAHAADYLLKPYSDDRFRLALGRAAQRARHARGEGAGAAGRSAGGEGAGNAAGDPMHDALRRLEALLVDVRGRAPAAAAAPPHLDRVVLKAQGRVRLLPVEEIAWVEAEGVYVRLHTAGGAAHLHRALLGELEAALDPRRFVRIHRSAIVNLDFVAELQADSHGEYAVLLRDRTALKLSRGYRPALEARLGQRL
jgi:two-component system LytT family response regulator